MNPNFLLYKEAKITIPGHKLDSLMGIIVEIDRTPGRQRVVLEVSGQGRRVFRPSQVSVTLGSETELTILDISPKPELPERPTLGEMLMKEMCGMGADAVVVRAGKNED